MENHLHTPPSFLANYLSFSETISRTKNSRKGSWLAITESLIDTFTRQFHSQSIAHHLYNVYNSIIRTMPSATATWYTLSAEYWLTVIGNRASVQIKLCHTYVLIANKKASGKRCHLAFALIFGKSSAYLYSLHSCSNRKSTYTGERGGRNRRTRECALCGMMKEYLSLYSIACKWRVEISIKEYVLTPSMKPSISIPPTIPTTDYGLLCYVYDESLWYVRRHHHQPASQHPVNRLPAPIAGWWRH